MASAELHITGQDTGMPLTPREKFLEERRHGIGGSDAAGLFPEDSRFGCPVRLFYEKRGYKPDFERTDKEKKILDRGNRLEDVAAEQFSLEYGFKVRRHPSRVHPEAPHLRVNIDRQIVNVTTEELLMFWPQIEQDLKSVIGDGSCGPGVLELKTSNEWVVRNAIKQGIIPDYIFQLQHGMAVTGYKWGVMAVLDTSSFELTAFPMVRNEKLIEAMRERADSFWALIENGPKPAIPQFPEGDTRCRGCIFRKTCRGEQWLMEQQGEKPDTGYVTDDSYAELAIDLKDAREQKIQAEQIEKNIIAVIQERMEQQKVAKIEIPSVGARIRWAQQKAPYKWDTKALEAEAGTIGRHVEFAKWVAESYPDFLAFWLEQKAKGQSLTIADKYKAFGKPTRPFVPSFL